MYQTVACKLEKHVVIRSNNMVIVDLYFRGLLKIKASKYDSQNEQRRFKLHQPKLLSLFRKVHQVFDFHFTH